MTDEELLKQINHIVASQLEPIKATQREHSTILQEHSIILREHSVILGDHTKSLHSLKKQLRKTNKTLNEAIDHFDRRLVSHGKRLDRIEGHLHLPPNQ